MMASPSPAVKLPTTWSPRSRSRPPSTSSERREELARRLASGQLRVAGKPELAEAERLLREATAARDKLAISIAEQLGAEAYLVLDTDAEQEARRVCPGLFDPSCDLSELRDLLHFRRSRAGMVVQAQGA